MKKTIFSVIAALFISFLPMTLRVSVIGRPLFVIASLRSLSADRQAIQYCFFSGLLCRYAPRNDAGVFFRIASLSFAMTYCSFVYVIARSPQLDWGTIQSSPTSPTSPISSVIARSPELDSGSNPVYSTFFLDCLPVGRQTSQARNDGHAWRNDGKAVSSSTTLIEYLPPVLFQRQGCRCYSISTSIYTGNCVFLAGQTHLNFQ